MKGKFFEKIFFDFKMVTEIDLISTGSIFYIFGMWDDESQGTHFSEAYDVLDHSASKIIPISHYD